MFLYASDFPLNMNIVGQHKVINQLLLDNFPEVDGKCKWSQLQRVYLNVMRAFDFKYGKIPTTKRRRVLSTNPKLNNKMKKGIPNPNFIFLNLFNSKVRNLGAVECNKRSPMVYTQLNSSK